MRYEGMDVVDKQYNHVVAMHRRVVMVGDENYLISSQGYAGIDQGLAVTLAVGTTEELYMDESRGESLASMIGEFIELDLQAYDEFTEEYTDRQDVLNHGLWVVYKYVPDLTLSNPEGYVYALPMEVFLDHSVRVM